MNILIDYREKKSRITHATHYFEGMNDHVHVQELPFGDYVFENRVVFEYKVLSDFVHSVKSGRVFNQCIEQSTVFPYHFCIIVASERERRGYFNKLRYIGNRTLYFDDKQYFGAISRLNTYTTVLQANNELEAFKFMRAQARKCLDNKHIVKRLQEKTDNPAFNWLMNIKHISDTKAELIVNELGLETLQDLLKVTNNDLQGIKGIGSQTSGIIMKSLRR